MTRRPLLRYSVTGPGVEKSYADPQVAISAAMTFADHLSAPGFVTVRDLDGTRVARLAKDEHGNTFFVNTEEAA